MSTGYESKFLDADPLLDLPARVRLWSVYEQRWIETAHPADHDLAAMGREERALVLRHLGRVTGSEPVYARGA